uniref:Gip1-like protein n=1 Tax=Petunia hybrida TaxID=4102 RepID=Q93WR4_PETHY|nr:Gip1-like protein [Petunia x hybrida]
MAKLASFFLLALIAISIVATTALAADGQYHLDAARYGPGSLKPTQCLPQCIRRCSHTQYHNACMLFCQKCCKKCLCVPPGFYGNKGVCPCYNNWKTKEGGPKCP